MSSCTECHGMAGEKYDDHVSSDCPRLKSRSAKTPEQKLQALLEKSFSYQIIQMNKKVRIEMARKAGDDRAA